MVKKMPDKIIAVCGSSSVDDRGAELAREVGRLIARKGCSLVCGGLGGVMEACCRGAREEGGMTIGILPGTSREDANPYVDVPIVTGLGHARNLIIVQTAHAVIALPGGPGTLSEIALALKVGAPVVALDDWEEISDIEHASSPAEAVNAAIQLASKNRR